MFLFAIVFGLSMDYEVFLLSRIKEEYDRTVRRGTPDNGTAVADGLAITARVITAAALIMFCVFVAFVLGDDRQLKLFGLGLGIAVLIDATIVRMVLVPATMELLGDRNWWLPRGSTGSCRRSTSRATTASSRPSTRSSRHSVTKNRTTPGLSFGRPPPRCGRTFGERGVYRVADHTNRGTPPRGTCSHMAKPLVVVESPAKAKTISKFLGNAYDVRASVGHVADLPSKGLAVDVDNGFKPTYELTERGKQVVKDLRLALKDASELYLATDEDREGEAISWHLLEHLKPKVPVKRMVFHEITAAAIDHAVNNPRGIDYGLVDAAETRRILDRLYGYEVSPVLWRRVNRGLSAGRVQSPSVRLIVQRERERIAFVAADYWDIDLVTETSPSFEARLVAVDGRRVASGKDFGDDGRIIGDVIALDEATARALATALEPADVQRPQRRGEAVSLVAQAAVHDVDAAAGRRPPAAPVGVAGDARRPGSLRAWLHHLHAYRHRHAVGGGDRPPSGRSHQASTGRSTLPPSPRQLHVEGEERPGGARGDPPDDAVAHAELAAERAQPAGAGALPADLAAHARQPDGRCHRLHRQRAPRRRRGRRQRPGGRDAEFAASGTTITFPGYRAVYVEAVKDEGDDATTAAERESLLPALGTGEIVPIESLTPEGHTTTPPPRYTEASLVKRLEELGIGRPSTWASIIQTIQDRGYVWKKGQALVPTWTAFAVVGLLEQHFDDLVDYAFTARVETDLDAIAGRRAGQGPLAAARSTSARTLTA